MGRLTHHASRFYALALFFFACGLMSKPMLVTTPFVLLLLDYWPLRRFRIEDAGAFLKDRGSRREPAHLSSREQKLEPAHAGCYKILLEKLPFLALCVASSVVTFVVQQRAKSTMDGLPLEPRVTNAILSYVKYLGKTLWPVDLAVFYPHPGIRGPAAEPPEWQVALAALLLVVVSVSVLLRLKREPWLTTGWFWFLGTLVPVIGIVQVGGQEIADRYTYMPLIGIFICFVWGMADFFAGYRFGPRALKLAGVLVIAACAIVSRQQVRYWRSNFTLFEHALAVTQNNAIAHYYVSMEYSLKGKSELAIDQLRKALEADPNNAEAYGALGYNLNALGRLDEAIDAYQDELRLKPWKAEAHNDIGMLLWKLGRGQEALDHYAESLRLKPENPDAHYSIGQLYSAEGKNQEAATNFSEAVRLKPDFVEARTGLGRALVLEGKLDDAAKEFEQAARLRPDVQSYYELGMVRVMKGNTKEAVAAYEQALRSNPDNLPALNDLAWLLATNPHQESRNGAEAVRLAEHARDLSGGKTARFWGTLDAAYAEAGRWPEAMQAARKARELARGAGEKDLAEAAERRLALYEKRQPFRQ